MKPIFLIIPFIATVWLGVIPDTIYKGSTVEPIGDFKVKPDTFLLHGDTVIKGSPKDTISIKFNPDTMQQSGDTLKVRIPKDQVHKK